MSETLPPADPARVLDRAHALLDQLHTLDLTGLAEDALLQYWRELERLRRRLPTAEHALVLEAEARGLPAEHHVRSTPAFLRRLLRLDPGEAAARVRAAAAAGPRRAMTGAPLPAIYPAVAAAQAHGVISDRHARLIVTTVDRLPDAAQAEAGEQVETDLVDYALRFDPAQLARLAERILAYYDPDATLDQVQHRAKHRELTLTPRPDGSARISRPTG